ncbi:hypothetical protein [Bradyrhizobium erythrophlei]|uniref:ParB-like nuclease domain-containing protein n=1 Tax=Bradyrhizobium erythrophlei TaxID=1437360 RepID=A0A1M7T709_9BRAD|nr:hypothetical protein [Bradyrhizobium erythrophlei]SHN66495.1 hypothetical protein SAMN05444170_0959 [Bradyrhizobium erythrophlei]
MPIDPMVLDEARALIVKAGLADFKPSSAAPASTSGRPIPIALIDPARRSVGTPNFDKPDPDRPGVIRSASILLAIRDRIPLPPLLLIHRPGEQRYRLWEGFHRFHLCAALGYTHMHAEFTTAEY